MTATAADLVALSESTIIAVAISGRQTVEQRLTRAAGNLRDLADGIERSRDSGEYLRPIHEISWALANLGLESLAGDVASLRAAEAVLAERRTL